MATKKMRQIKNNNDNKKEIHTQRGNLSFKIKR